MATYYVETYRPAYPVGGCHCHVCKENAFTVDGLSPNMTAVFKVQDCHNGNEAVARVLEHAAGIGSGVTLYMGGKRNEMGNRVPEVPKTDSAQPSQ